MTDPVSSYVAELDRNLCGPADIRSEMIRETRDGLDDAAAAYRRAGLDPAHAAELAVRDFGSVGEVAPLLQDELVADQGRRTALMVAILFPVMVLGWDLLWSSGNGWGQQASAAVPGLPGLQDVISAAVAVLALGLLVAVLRQARSPRRAVAAISTIAVGSLLATVGVAVTMNVVNAAEAWRLFSTRPAATLAYLATGAILVLVARSALRTLRTLRRRPLVVENEVAVDASDDNPQQLRSRRSWG